MVSQDMGKAMMTQEYRSSDVKQTFQMAQKCQNRHIFWFLLVSAEWAPN